MNSIDEQEDTLENKHNALIIGSKGTIGRALVRQLGVQYQTHEISRENGDYSESHLANEFKHLSQIGTFDLIICCIGVLHDDAVFPEKSLQDINAQKLQHYYTVNAILPMLCIKHLSPLLDKSRPSAFICLSAMVGSTEDNKLGGWYGYRAAKAALNSLIKSSSIELRRKNKNAIIAALHPGTTVGELTSPFAKNIAPHKYYTPEQTANRIINVARQLTLTDSGLFFNWDGNRINW